jgi:hypothetical protein
MMKRMTLTSRLKLTDSIIIRHKGVSGFVENPLYIQYEVIAVCPRNTVSKVAFARRLTRSIWSIQW